MPSYKDVAISVAREAGQYLLSHRGKISPEMIDEKAINDFVTEVDENSEKMIVESIRSHFPEHKILAEEGTTYQSENEYRWIIDPLDGTKNFIQNIPMFSISIALEKDGEIVLGVVYDPVHNELFSAEKGKGAFCNDSAIRISQRELERAVIATGFPFKYKNYLPQYLLCFEDIFLSCSGMRRCGSAAIDLCYTAMGRFEGFWELGLSEWDMAAGSLLITEAGGRVSDFRGGNRYLKSGFIVAGNSKIHRQLLEIIQQHFTH
jgi:myo-inositol-1(or 4)-monophosphatase